MRGGEPDHDLPSRREALRRLGVAASAGALGLVPVLAACDGGDGDAAGTAAATSARSASAATGDLGDLGVQLYTVRDEMARDVGATLAHVAEIGYREVEFAGYFDHSAAEIRDLLSAAGLRAPSAHVDELLAPDPGPVLEAANVIGHEWVLVAWTPEEMRSSLDDWRRMAERFNRIGEAARSAGLRFGYHNHDFEIPPMEGRVPLDVLMEETDPELVDLELDLFWITHGGGDPIAFMERWPGRIRMVHVKDRSADGRMVDVGAGVIDFAAILGHRREAGIEHYFVEHDEPGDPWASIAAGYRTLNTLHVG